MSLGIAEILAAVGIALPGMTRVMPWLVTWTAGGIMIVMVSATIYHVMRAEYSSAVITLVLLAMATTVAYMRHRVLPIAPGVRRRGPAPIHRSADRRRVRLHPFRSWQGRLRSAGCGCRTAPDRDEDRAVALLHAAWDVGGAARRDRDPGSARRLGRQYRDAEAFFGEDGTGALGDLIRPDCEPRRLASERSTGNSKPATGD